MPRYFFSLLCYFLIICSLILAINNPRMA